MNNNSLYTFTSCPHCQATNKVLTQKILSNPETVVCGKCQKFLPFHQLVTEVNAEGMNKVISSANLPVVVDFWAPWCGPCRSFAPTFEAASKFAEGKMVFLKINTENHPQVSAQFNIRGIPTLMIFKNGHEVARESGAFPFDLFTNWISRFY